MTQGDADAKLMWDQVYKMVSTKNNVLVYSNRVNAYVIPRQQLGEKYRELAEIAKEKLPKYRVKLKDVYKRQLQNRPHLSYQVH